MADSYNELFGLGSHSEDASLEGWWPLQDDAASTAVDDVSSNGNDGTLEGGDNTADLSITGPNSYLTKQLDLDGVSDAIILASQIVGSGNHSFLARLNFDSLNTNFRWMGQNGNDAGDFICRLANTSGNLRFLRWTGTGNGIEFWSTSTLAVSATTDHNVAIVYDGDPPTFYLDKSSEAGGSMSTGGSTQSAENTTLGRWDTLEHSGPLSECAIFSRALTSAEEGQWEDGPEPINSVAPAMTGTETEGQTLSCTTGTWGLDAPFASGSNGTVTYAYQWTRSDNASGLNEADISGATSSTYTLTASDVGKFIRCRVRASNDGGFDSSADTNSNMSGSIASASGASVPALDEGMLRAGLQQMTGGLA